MSKLYAKQPLQALAVQDADAEKEVDVEVRLDMDIELTIEVENVVELASVLGELRGLDGGAELCCWAWDADLFSVSSLPFGSSVSAPAAPAAPPAPSPEPPRPRPAPKTPATPAAATPATPPATPPKIPPAFEFPELVLADDDRAAKLPVVLAETATFAELVIDDNGPASLLEPLLSEILAELLLADDDALLAPPPIEERMLTDETSEDAVDDNRLDPLLDVLTELVPPFDDELSAPLVLVGLETVDTTETEAGDDGDLDPLRETPRSELLRELLAANAAAAATAADDIDIDELFDWLAIAPAALRAATLLVPCAACLLRDGGGVGWAPSRNIGLGVLKWPLRSTTSRSYPGGGKMFRPGPGPGVGRTINPHSYFIYHIGITVVHGVGYSVPKDVVVKELVVRDGIDFVIVVQAGRFSSLVARREPLAKLVMMRMNERREERMECMMYHVIVRQVRTVFEEDKSSYWYINDCSNVQTANGQRSGSLYF